MIGEDFVRKLVGRLQRLEDSQLGYRQGVVTAITPSLSVALGGSATSYTSVRALDAQVLSVGQAVSVLVLGNHDLLILGALAGSPGTRGFQTGAIKFSAVAAVGSGWLVCDGSAVSRTTYAALFTAIGTTFGSGNGSTTFNVPDLLGRAIVGSGAGSGLTSRSLAAKFGTETHALSTAELAAHTHTDGTLAVASHTHTTPDHNHTLQAKADVGSGASIVSAGNSNGSIITTTSITTTGGGSTSGSASPDVTGATGSAGSGTAHANTQPSIAIAHFIKT